MREGEGVARDLDCWLTRALFTVPKATQTKIFLTKLCREHTLNTLCPFSWHCTCNMRRGHWNFYDLSWKGLEKPWNWIVWPLFSSFAEWSRETLLEAWMTDPIACCDKCGVTPPPSLFSEKPQVQENLASPIASSSVHSFLPCGTSPEAEVQSDRLYLFFVCFVFTSQEVWGLNEFRA